MAKETKGGTWIDVNSNDKKGHVNVYGSDPKEPHDESIHININYNNGTFNINEKSNGEKTSSIDFKCFLTTSCMKRMKESFDNNCYELSVLRWFRDNFVSQADINHYYEMAPVIVSAINNTLEKDIIYNYIYDDVIDFCVTAIENGEYELAYNRYKNAVLGLEETFVRPVLQKKLNKTL